MADTPNTVTISRAAAVTAVRDGAEAQRAGKDSSECPHNVAGTPEERFAANFWIKGHTTAANST